MSVTLPFPTEPELKPAPVGNGLDDLVTEYAVPDDLPPADWLVRLKLERPRQSIRCLTEFQRICKRLVDIAGASVLLVLLTPVMLFTALLVRLTSKGPIIFRQTRVGLNSRRPKIERRKGDVAELDHPDRRSGIDRRLVANYGELFTLYKFRTMRTDAEKNGAQFAVKGDSRITPIGRFLRKTRLDELPQLWNVLRGDMSLVGPRPERPEFIKGLSEAVPGYLDRLGLRPGLTGLAQVVNGYDNDLAGFRRKVAFDLLYLQNCCLWNDIKILFRTIRVVLTGSGAL